MQIYLYCFNSTVRLCRLDHHGDLLLAFHLVNQVLQRRIHFVEEGVRINADPEHEQQQRAASDHDLPCREIFQLFVGGIFQFADHDPLEHPEHVNGSEDNPAGRNDCEPTQLTFKGPQQDQKFADEAVGSGQADGREGDDQEDRGKYRHLFGQPAELGRSGGYGAARK